jgi:hypothetical protein
MSYRSAPLSLSPRTCFLIFLALITFAFLTGFEIRQVQAQDAWCTANTANCVCSDTFQHTSYSITAQDGNGFSALGNLPNTKPCYREGVQHSITAIYGENSLNAIRVAADASVLAGLPNRNPSSMARYLRPNYDNFGFGTGYPATLHIGHHQISLGSAKRLAMRWYWYHSSDWEYTWQGSDGCTNGKFAQVGAANQAGNYLLITGHYNRSSIYDTNSSNGWVSNYATPWEGFTMMKGPYGSSGGIDYNTIKGKWVRAEIIVRRPRVADALGSGFDVEFWITNVTDRGTPQQDLKLSAGCTNCFTAGGVPSQNFVWTTAFRQTVDIADVHMQEYRAAEGGTGCRGWSAWAYATVAKWDTDEGQMIGPAVEVEGGSRVGVPNAPSSLGLK